VLTAPDVDLTWLTEFYPDTAGDPPLLFAVVDWKPKSWQHASPNSLPSTSSIGEAATIRGALQNHIAKFGAVTLDKLYEAPFTQVSQDGPDGVFDEATIEDLIVVMTAFARPLVSGQRIARAAQDTMDNHILFLRPSQLRRWSAACGWRCVAIGGSSTLPRRWAETQIELPVQGTCSLEEDRQLALAGHEALTAQANHGARHWTWRAMNVLN
jgi:hypothetical protein